MDQDQQYMTLSDALKYDRTYLIANREASDQLKRPWDLICIFFYLEIENAITEGLSQTEKTNKNNN